MAKNNADMQHEYERLMEQFTEKYNVAVAKYAGNFVLLVDLNTSFVTLIRLLTDKFDMVIFELHMENCKYTMTARPSNDIRSFDDGLSSKVERLRYLLDGRTLWPNPEVLYAFIAGYNASQAHRY